MSVNKPTANIKAGKYKSDTKPLKWYEAFASMLFFAFYAYSIAWMLCFLRG
jgi:hypothetical protein